MIEVLLLRSYDTARANYSHECYRLVGGEAILPDEIGPNQSTGTAETCFALGRDIIC